MVDAVTAISASSATSPTKVESSLSITSEPDNKWVAERQSQIDADQVALKNALAARDDGAQFQEDTEVPIPLFEGHSHKRQKEQSSHSGHSPAGEAEGPALSGESERIGTTNFDEETPFGKRVAII